tara:strand:+ start:3385 stop:3654 length:270 start_codon:yes stop_codon:yes gene_type:complete
MINNIEKTPLKSKKFLALVMMMLLTGGVLLLAVFMRAPADVINTAITVLGGTCGASCASFIGAQGFVDGKVRAAAIETEVVEVEIQREK